MHRRGISLVELLLVIAIIGVLMSLLLPAVMAVRQRVLLLECMANAKNIVGAAHSYGAARKGALPHLGWFHYNLLTYLEGSTYYGKTGDDLPKKSSVYIPTYLCPLDPMRGMSVSSLGIGTSYAVNAVALEGIPSLKTTFRDGLSSTVLLGEHYAYWSRSGPDGTVDSYQFHWFLLLERYLGSVEYPIAVPGTRMRIYARAATFADKVYGDVVPRELGHGKTRASVPGLTFQIRPRIEDADPRIPQTPHAAGMVSGFADGHVRVLKGGMAEEVFWALVTPAGGEIVTLEE